MTRRLVLPVAALVLAAAVSGCTGNQQLEAELHRFRDSSKSQLDLLKKQNELLNRKLNDMNETVDEFADTGDRLSTELATYVNRPEEVKLEIITEVNNRFGGIATGQEEFKEDINEMFEQETAAIKADVEQNVEEMQNTLTQHISFVQFVATQQDSINRVFANRFDSRPWYESVLGKWDDMERRKQEAP